MKVLRTSFTVMALVLTGTVAFAQGLGGSRASLNRQENQARAHDFTFMENGSRVNRFVSAGLLVPVKGNSDYDLSGISYPYARPATKLFIERLSRQYRAACGEKLTVTSLTRPANEQPPNSSEKSVHPTGMGIDLRVPENNRCRAWLERVLLSLEDANVLEATRERNPPHYHVAIFPAPYERYVASLQTGSREYVVRKGDSLSAIARATGATVEALKTENGIQGDTILVGQTIRVPSGAAETYPIKPGDTLEAIARLYGTTVAALRSANGLRGDLIHAGQILLVSFGDPFN